MTTPTHTTNTFFRRCKNNTITKISKAMASKILQNKTYESSDLKTKVVDLTEITDSEIEIILERNEPETNFFVGIEIEPNQYILFDPSSLERVGDNYQYFSIKKQETQE